MFRFHKTGMSMLNTSLSFIQKHPVFLAPLMAVWVIYALTIFYFRYSFSWDEHSLPANLVIFFFIIVFFSILLATSNLIVLELLEQLETGKKFNFIKAFGNALGRNFIRALPIIVSWAFIWFILELINMIVTTIRSKIDRNHAYSPEDAVKVLSGFENVSIWGLFNGALIKGIRMLVFLILPGIAWDNNDSFLAIKKGIGVLKLLKKEFIAGFPLTILLMSLILLPISVMMYLHTKLHVDFPDMVWYLSLVYLCFSWSFGILVEQLYCAELYLWFIVWEDENKLVRTKKRKLAKLELNIPDLLDNRPDLLRIEKFKETAEELRR